MSLLSFIFGRQEESLPEPKPEKPKKYCPACGDQLGYLKGKDGVYCASCANLISFFFAYLNQGKHRYYGKYICSACAHPFDSSPRQYSEEGETVFPCPHCHSPLHAPEGTCPACWQKTANNGLCVNYQCPSYQTSVVRLVPIFQVAKIQPHCTSCGHAYSVFIEGVTYPWNPDLAWTPNSWVWVSSRKGCSQCGAPYTPSAI